MNCPETFNDVWVLGRKGLCVEERTKWKSYFQVLYRVQTVLSRLFFFLQVLIYFYFFSQLQVSVSDSVGEGED